MIAITCPNCRNQLSIDDAFAGGVCRCQYCGAIQTVPKQMVRSGRPASPGVPAGTTANAHGQKTLYTRKTGAQPVEAQPLSDLADVVAGSGFGSGHLSGSGVNNPMSGSGLPGVYRRGPGKPGPSNRHVIPILIVATVIVLALTGVLIWLALENHRPLMPVAHTSAGQPATGTPVFLGVPVQGANVAYVIDRGHATVATFDYAKLAVLRSLGTLRADQKFQVIFWKTSKIAMFPTTGPTAATPDAISDCQKALDHVDAYDASEVAPAIEAALKSNPDLIVIATGKVVGRDFLDAVLAARKNTKVKINCVSLNEPSSATAMQSVAEKTGGVYRDVSMDELVNSTR